jgi:hypothetical protein
MTYFTANSAPFEYDEHGFEIPGPTEWCLNYPSDDCEGMSQTRYSRSGLTQSVKCDGCQNVLDEALDRIQNRYPDSSVAPSWFDPTYAGESWDSDY